MPYDDHLHDFDSTVQKLYQNQGSIKCIMGKGLTNIPSTPTMNADSTKGFQNYSLNINATEVGHGLGKESKH